MPEGATMMHEMSLDRLNDTLAKAEQTFAEIEDRAQEYGRATYEGARRVEEWARGIIEQDNEYSSLFVTKVDEINESRAREQEVEKMVIQTTEENKREEEIYRQEAVELEGVVSELQSQKDKLPDDEERLMESLREKRELCEDRDHQIREMESRLDSKVSEYQGTLNIYQDALGLKLEVIDNSHVRYVFVCIDPSAHDRTFAVATKFNGGDGLLATECKPTIERFPELKEKLSNDGKLVPFLREMRKEFQKLAVSGH